MQTHGGMASPRSSIATSIIAVHGSFHSSRERPHRSANGSFARAARTVSFAPLLSARRQSVVRTHYRRRGKDGVQFGVLKDADDLPPGRAVQLDGDLYRRLEFASAGVGTHKSPGPLGQGLL